MYRDNAWRAGPDRRSGSDWRGQRYERQVGYRIESGGGAGTGITERIGDVGDTIGERAEEVGQKVGQVGDRVSQTIGQGVDRVGSRVGDVPDEMSYKMRDLGDQARSFLDQSPLAVGVVAVAVGTAVGAVLPVTRTERRVLGPATERMIDTAERTATQALSEMETQTGGQSGQGGQARQSGGPTGGQAGQSGGQAGQSSGRQSNQGSQARGGQRKNPNSSGNQDRSRASDSTKASTQG
jgi:hypothetical protein